MACKSGSVQKVVDKSDKAKDAVLDLEARLKTQDGVNKTEFYSQIESHFGDALITDAREIAYNSNIKTEYTSEFSLDKIAGVVTSALNALAKNVENPLPNSAISPDAIEAYIDVVNNVAEAAKSSSTLAGNLAFSMTRLSPGWFAFLYAKSVIIEDIDTFGKESVTSTAVYYRLMQSIDDLKNENEFNDTLLDIENIGNMKRLQATALEDLVSGAKEYEQWEKIDAMLTERIEAAEQRLAERGFTKRDPVMLGAEQGVGAPVLTASPVQEAVRFAIRRLSAKGDVYQAAVEKAEARLAEAYF